MSEFEKEGQLDQFLKCFQYQRNINKITTIGIANLYGWIFSDSFPQSLDSLFILLRYVDL